MSKSALLSLMVMPSDFFRIGNQEFGPVDVKVIKRAFISGELDQSQTYIRKEGDDRWVSGSKLTFKSDPRPKASSSRPALPPVVEVVESVDELEVVDQRPAAEASATTPKSRPSLYDPSTAYWLSFLFTPAFNAFLHARNWQTLGRPDKATAHWVVFGLVLGLNVLLAFMASMAMLFHDSAWLIGLTLGLIWLLAAVGLTWLLWLGRQQLAYVDGKFDGKHPTRSIPAAVWWVAVGWSLVINGILSAMVDLKLSRRSEQGLAVAGRSDSGLVAARRGVPAGVSVKPMRHQIEFGKRPPWGPSAGGLELVQYDAPLGKMWAYVTQPPFGAGKRPAILWITGGDCNSLGDVSDRHDPDNDQSAAVYRTLDFVTMYPSLRGGHDNPGERELFYGEVDDVLAAAEYLARLPYVDPKQIYLGGHSTGGTLVLLAAACSDRFRAVFSFGPTDDVRRYDDLMPEILKLSNKQAWLRSPIEWLEDISSPTFVMEGAENGNVRALQAMQARSTNPQIQFLLVPMHDHFSILGHGNQIIAGKIFGDNGAKCNLKLSVDELRRRDGNAPLRIAGFEPKHISPIEQPQFRSLLDEPRRRLPIPFDDPGGVPPGLRRRQQGASVKPPPNLQKPADMSDDEWVDRLLSELEGLKPTDHQSIEDHVEALSATGSERAIRPIVKRVADVYPKAEQALVPFGPKAESVILDELETAKDNEYVRRLADALGAVGTDRSLPILERLSKHPYTWAKVAASFSTTKIERRQRVLQYQDR